MTIRVTRDGLIELLSIQTDTRTNSASSESDAASEL